MKTSIFYKAKGLFVIVFLLNFSFFARSQDTVTYNDSKYYWNNEPSDSDSVKILLRSKSSAYSDKDNYHSVICSKRIIFPPNTERIIYGIAGTTVTCMNPKGCYFYLGKKNRINDTLRLQIIDSVKWDSKSIDGYVDYNIDTIIQGMTLNHHISHLNSLAFPNGDSTNVVPAYEGYFPNPVAVSDTFYIGMNPNVFYMDGNYTFYDALFLGQEYYPNQHFTMWTLWLDKNFITETTDLMFNGALFPILEPATNRCLPVGGVRLNNVDASSAAIDWINSYMSAYSTIEYGVEGFEQGCGTIIDNITTPNIVLNNLEPNTRYTIYIRSCCISDNIYSYSDWESISFQTLDTTCAVVENLDTIYVQDVRARIRWDITSDEVLFCQMEWGESGFEQGSGNFKNNIYDTTYFFQNLAAATTYDVYVRTYCQRSGIYSDWQKLTFTTDGNSINEAENQLPISVNPNPTTGMVEVTLPQGYENQTVEVYDVQGKLLQSQRLQNGKATFNLSEYPNGVYVIKAGNTSCRVVKSK